MEDCKIATCTICIYSTAFYPREHLKKNQAKGGITSEALQPIYELKHVAERSSKSSEEVLAYRVAHLISDGL